MPIVLVISPLFCEFCSLILPQFWPNNNVPQHDRCLTTRHFFVGFHFNPLSIYSAIITCITNNNRDRLHGVHSNGRPISETLALLGAISSVNLLSNVC